MKRVPLVTAVLALLGAALPAAGHVIEIDGVLYNPHDPFAPPIELLVEPGQPATFSVTDLGGCEATIFASAPPGFIEVSPAQSSGPVVSQTFTVTALASVTELVFETLSVSWTGRDAGGSGPCQEIFGTQILVTVIPAGFCDDEIECSDDGFDLGSDACQNEPRDCDDANAATVDICDEDDGSCQNVVPAPGVCKAYVLIGDFNGVPGQGLYTGRAVGNTADEAVSDYEDAGYTVVRIDQARSSDLFTALNDPETKAIWFLGHGGYESKTGLLGFEKVGNPTPSLAFVDRYVDPNLVRAGTGKETFPNIEQVTLHACDQDLQGWRDMFPTAVSENDFDAWSVPIKGFMFYWWQFGATYDSACQSPFAPQAVASSGGPPPVVHPSLEPLGAVEFKDPFFVLNLEAVTNSVPPFLLSSAEAAAFEGRSFNFWIGHAGGPSLLFSTSIVGGTIDVAAQSVDPDPAPDFEITISHEAFRSLLEQPNLWATLVGTPAVTVANHSGGVLSDARILDAVEVIMLGPGAAVPSSSYLGRFALVFLLLLWAGTLADVRRRRARAGE